MINSPAHITTTASSALASVSGTLYRMAASGTLNPSMSIKWPTQTQHSPNDTPASSSQRPRAQPP